MTDNKGSYILDTVLEKLVADYTNISFFRVAELDYDVFMFFAREAFIYKCYRTESGQEYLSKCWILEQTQPDRQGLRKQFGDSK